MAVAAGSMPARALRRRPWCGGGRLAGRAGPRRAVGLAVELPRAVLRAGELRAAVGSAPRGRAPRRRELPPGGLQAGELLAAAAGRAGRAGASLPAAAVSELGTSSRAPARPSPAAAVSAAAGRSGSGGGGGAGAERQRQRSSSRTAAGPRLRPCGRRWTSSLVLFPLALTWRPPLALRPCGWRRASSLVLVSPRSPGARR